MKTPLGTEVDLGPGHIVLDGEPAPPRKGHSSPLFSAHVYCGHGRPSQLLLSCCANGRPKRVLFRIYMSCNSYDCFLRKDVLFGGRDEAAPNLGVKSAENPIFGA